MESDAHKTSQHPLRLTLAALVAVVCLGSFLRLHHLGTASLWIDEITFVNESNPDSGLWTIARHMWSTYHWQHQPALPRMVESAWLRVVRWLDLPLDETMYRLPAALMGIASIAVLYLLGRRLFNEGVGLLSAFLLSISFLHVYYSREAYNYSPFFLCALLSWYFLARIMGNLLSGEKARRTDLAWYAATTALTLQMVMAAILFVFSQFIALALVSWAGPLQHKSNQEKSALLKPVLLSHFLAWMPFLPFLWKLLHYESADKSAVHPQSVAPFLGMLGEMGWSNQPVSLLLFLVLFAAGVWVGLTNPRTREASVLCLLLGVFGAIGVGYIEKLGRFETRYFIGLLPALLLFVAVSSIWLGRVMFARLPIRLRPVVSLLACTALLAWHAPFYDQLFRLKAKLFCGRCVAEWITENTPAGTAYVLDSAYVRREVPAFYPTPGRYGSAPPAHVSPEEYPHIYQFLLDLFRRFPDCYYVDTQHVRFDDSADPPSAWCQKLFRRHVRIENPAIFRLIEMGIFPSASFHPGLRNREAPNLTADIYYNTREDILEKKRLAGGTWVALFGPEWVHSEVPLSERDLDHFKSLHERGRIFVFGLQPQSYTAEVLLNCGSYQMTQSIQVQLNNKTTTYDLAADRRGWLPLGEMHVEPGKNEIVITKKTPQATNEVANFLVHEIELRPR